MKKTLLGVSVALALASCSRGRSAAPICAASEVNPCTCAGGAPGIQTCDPSGAFYGVCRCTPSCADGAACAAMPDVTGKDLDSAGALITAAGLELPDPVDPQGFVTVERVVDPPVQILEQDPPAGAMLPVGARVRLRVTMPPDQESLGLPNSSFLVGHLAQDTEATAQAYYDVVDPPPLAKRSTLADWKRAAGFGTPADAEASAIYVTHTDLGFGRHMHLRRKGRYVAFYVDNYPSIEDTIAGTRLIATVAMEWGPAPGAGPDSKYFTQFFTFNKKGVRIYDPALDDHGHKLQPAVCLACHGGDVNDPSYARDGGNLGAKFIPFDLDAAAFSTRPGYTRRDQEAAFKVFNEAVQATWLDDRDWPAGEPMPVPTLIDGWYGGAGHPRATQDSSFIPPGWSESSEARQLYAGVFKRSCQTCHAQREPARNFSTYAKFAAKKDLIHQRVFEEGAMPLSQRGSLNFWLSYPQQPTILARWLGTPLRSPGQPLPRVRVVHDGPFVTPGSQVTLDAGDSQYANQYDWRQISGPPVALSPGSTASVVAFTSPGGAASAIAFELVVRLGDAASPPLDTTVLSQTPPSAPTAVSVTPGAGVATVGWTAPASDGLSAIASYAVRVEPGGATTTVPGNRRQAVVSNLVAGATYTATVTAENALGDSPASAAVQFGLPTVPAKPSAPSLTPGNGQLAVGFAAPADGSSPILHYTLVAAPAGGGSARQIVAPAGSTSATLSALTNGVHYSVTLFATNAVGDGPASDAVVATPAGVPAAPAAFTAVAGNASVTLQWSPPADTGGVPLTRYLLTGSAGISAQPAASATQLTLNNLVNGTPYSFQLVADNGVFQGATAAAGPVTPATLPGTPASASATAGNGQATVSWTAPASNGGSAITSYSIVASPGGATASAGAAATSAIVGGLSNGTVYTFAVSAVNGVGQSATPAVTSAVMPSATPGVPSAPSLTGATPSASQPQAQLTWTAPLATGTSAITSYTMTATPTTAGATITQATNSTALSAQMAGLTGGLSYRFTVAATNAAGTGPASAQSAVTAVVGPPQPPGALAVQQQDGKLVLSWTAPANTGGQPLTGYRVSWPQAPASSVSLAASAAGTTITGLTPGTSYDFSVVAQNQSGNGAAATASAVFAVKPLAPASASALPGNGSASVSWTAPGDTGGIAVLDYTVTWTPSNPGDHVTVSALSTAVNGLTNGTTYSFTVVARNAVGTSASGTSTNAIIPSTTPGVPGPPTLNSVTPGTEQVALGWSPPAVPGNSPVNGYVLTALPQPSGTPITANALATDTSGSITGLTGGSSYRFTVSATNQQGTGSPSAASASTPIVGRPQPPGVVTATQGNGVINLSWTAPANNGGSSILDYDVSWAQSPGGAQHNVAATSTSVSSLTVGTFYTFVVTTRNQYGSSGSAQSASTEFVTAPANPTSVTATPGNGQLGVSWVAPANTGGLALGNYLATLSPGGTQQSVAGTSTTFTSLTNNTVYSVSVQATNTAGSSAGAASNAVMPSSTPGVPSAPSITGVTPGVNQASLTWSAPVAPGTSSISSYTITATPTTAGSTVSHATGSSSLGGSISGLVGGLSYTFTVSATNGSGAGPNSPASGSVAIVGPPQPPTSVAVAQHDGYFTATWTAPANTGGVALSASGGYLVTWSPNPPGAPQQVNGNTTTANISGLTAGTTYTVSVAANNQYGASAYAAGPATAFATAPAAPTITGLSATPDGLGGYLSGQLTVNWTAGAANGSPITGYAITATPRGAGNSGSASPSGGTSTTITGLSNCVQYDVAMTESNGVGTSSQSASFGPAQPMTVPTGMAFTAVSPQPAAVQLNWTVASHGCAIDQVEVSTFDDQTFTTSLSYPGASATSSYMSGHVACLYPSVSCASPHTWEFNVRAHNAAGWSAYAGWTGSVRPLVSYSSDNVVGIWTSTTEAGSHCVSCHISGGNMLVLDTSTFSTWSNIRNTANVIKSPAASSYLLLCPTNDANCHPYGNATTHPGGYHFSTTSTEYRVINQWILDGTQF